MPRYDPVPLDADFTDSEPNGYADVWPEGGRDRTGIEGGDADQQYRRPHDELTRAVVAGSWPIPREVVARHVLLPTPAMSFGRFDILPQRRLLLELDRPIQIGSRAFDILVALVERAGELVSKGELMARGWPNTFVEESNLKVQIAALRRTLRDGEEGNRYISNVIGRGYWFVAPVARSTGMS
jgi:DNA-binding winged helix-turn-helix (wHTH) protein